MHRKYLFLVFCPLAVVWFGLLFFALSLQPLRGDLTRLGGYSENDFGWNGTEDKFEPPLARVGLLTGYYDIVVSGDSFSSRTTPDRQTPNGSFWTDFLANRTGLRIGVFDHGKTSMAQYLRSDSYLFYPPKVLIYETVERALEANLSEMDDSCSPITDLKAIDIPIKALFLTPKRIWRARFSWLTEEQFDYAADYLKKIFFRFVFANEANPVIRLSLSRPDLFTNKRSSDLLVFHDDLVKSRWSGKQWNQFSCNLHRMRAEAERNGVTRFVAMVAPDKGTIYSDYVLPQRNIPNGITILTEISSVPMPRIDLALKAAASIGTKDLYMPNDTHWGTTGAKIAAEEVAKYISDSARQN